MSCGAQAVTAPAGKGRGELSRILASQHGLFEHGVAHGDLHAGRELTTGLHELSEGLRLNGGLDLHYWLSSMTIRVTQADPGL